MGKCTSLHIKDARKKTSWVVYNAGLRAPKMLEQLRWAKRSGTVLGKGCAGDRYAGTGHGQLQQVRFLG